MASFVKRIKKLLRKSKNCILIWTIVLVLVIYIIFPVNILWFKSLVKLLSFQMPFYLCHHENISSLLSLDQKDSCVIEFIRTNHLIPPPNYKGPNPKVPFTSGTEFSKIIYKFFKHKRRGSFLEVGAHDGISEANTLFLEQLGWTGLLIECNPLLVPKLKKTNRKAWISDACLSTIPKPQIVNLTTLKEWPASAQLWNPPPEEEQKKWGFDKFKDPNWYYYQIPAFPLYSIILATQSFSEIDYLSLDVQGIELEILRNFPFADFMIKVIIMEVAFYNSTERGELVELLGGHGYKLWKEWEWDYGFVHRSLSIGDYDLT